MLESAAAASGTVTGILGQDHRRLAGLLADAKRALVTGELARAAALFAAFRDGLESHIVVEEETLFPAFESLTGMTGGPTRVMRDEHADIRAYMADVATRLATGGAEGLAGPLASLTALLYAHNGKEERILYPATDRAASAAGTLETLVRRLAP